MHIGLPNLGFSIVQKFLINCYYGKKKHRKNVTFQWWPVIEVYARQFPLTKSYPVQYWIRCLVIRPDFVSINCIYLCIFGPEHKHETLTAGLGDLYGPSPSTDLYLYKRKTVLNFVTQLNKSLNRNEACVYVHMI